MVIVRLCRAQNVDVSGCGQTKGCFKEPQDCDGAAASCEFLLTWRNDSSDAAAAVVFEMSADVDSETPWIAFGLSMDTNMVTFRWPLREVYCYEYVESKPTVKKMYSSLQTCLDATGTRVSHGITWCYPSSSRGDVPA